jgi:hypothetical protein
MSPEAALSHETRPGTYVKLPQPGPQQASKPHLVARLSTPRRGDSTCSQRNEKAISRSKFEQENARLHRSRYGKYHNIHVPTLGILPWQSLNRWKNLEGKPRRFSQPRVFVTFLCFYIAYTLFLSPSSLRNPLLSSLAALFLDRFLPFTYETEKEILIALPLFQQKEQVIQFRSHASPSILLCRPSPHRLDRGSPGPEMRPADEILPMWR